MISQVLRRHSRREFSCLSYGCIHVPFQKMVVRGISKSSLAICADKIELGDDPRKKSAVLHSDEMKSARFIPKKREQTSEKGFSVSIDKSGLLKTGTKWPTQIELNSIEANKETATPLVKYLRSIIQGRGPMSVHDYMSQALHHAEHGYYQHTMEKIGSEGDFVTSPEISQLFGEMIGIWCVATWESMGRPAAFNLIEMGPGKGTLMRDMLNIVNKFPECKKAVTVHMVELSEFMRRVQIQALCEEAAVAVEGECVASESKSDNQMSEEAVSPDFSGVTKNGNVIHWHSYLRHVPRGPAVYVGQEILDAFPVYQFVKTDGAWREKMVDVDFEPDSPFHFRFVQSPTPTPATRVFFDKNLKNISLEPLSMMRLQTAAAGSVARAVAEMGTPKPDLENTKSSDGEPLSISSKASSVNKRMVDNILQHNASDNVEQGKPTDIAELRLRHGLYDESLDSLEVCPLAYATVEEVATNVREHGGAALFIDYGENFPQGDTIRGFKKHQNVNILSEPGNIDITADVNFKACGQVGREQGASVQGPVTQGEFLCRMGIIERVEQILDGDIPEEDIERIVASVQRIIGDEETYGPTALGNKFKVIAITNSSLVTPGFGEEDGQDPAEHGGDSSDDFEEVVANPT